MADATTASGGQGAAGKPGRGGSAPGGWATVAQWVRAAAGLLIVIAVAFGLWWLFYREGVVRHAHQQNFRDLAVAAQGLDTWPDSVAGVARANFTNNRLKASSDTDAAAGFPLVFEQANPGLGVLRVLYALPPTTREPDDAPDRCKLLSRNLNPTRLDRQFVASTRPGGDVEFVVDGTLRLEDVWLSDMAHDAALPAAAERARAVYAHLSRDLVAATERAQPPAAAGATHRVVCYHVSVDLDRLVPIRTVAAKFSNVLIARHDGRVVAQIGANRLPVTNIYKLPHVGSQFEKVSATAVKVVDKDAKPVADEHREADFADALEPQDTVVATQRYIAYTQPLKIPDCDPAAAVAAGAAAAVPGPAAASKTAAAKPAAPPAATPADCATTYIAIGLMPEAVLSSDTKRPPAAIAVGFTLVALLALVLVPVLRMALIGPADSIRATEVAVLPFAVVGATALATLAVLLAFDLARHRAAAADTSAAVATAMSASAGKEISRTLDVMQVCYREGGLFYAEGFAAPTGGYPQIAPEQQVSVRKKPLSSREQEDLDARNERRKKSKLRPVEPPEHPCLGERTDSGLPVVEFLALFGGDGRQVPGTTFVNADARGTNRAIIAGRDYFHHLIDGRFDYVADLRPGKNDPPPFRFTIGQIKSQTDGTNRTVVALDAALGTLGPSPVALSCSKDLGAGPPCVLAAVGDLRTFLHPVLPPDQAFMVVDTSDPDLPVVLHSQSARAGVERLAAEGGIDLGTAQRLRDLSEAAGKGVPDTAGATPKPPRFDQPPPPMSFAADYDGTAREFAAVAVRGTPWVVLAFHATDDIDRIAGRGVSRALLSWTTMAILFAILLGAFGTVSSRLGAVGIHWRWTLAGAGAVMLLLAGLTFAAPPLAAAACAALAVCAILFWTGPDYAGAKLRALWPAPGKSVCGPWLWRWLALDVAVTGLATVVTTGIFALVAGLAGIVVAAVMLLIADTRTAHAAAPPGPGGPVAATGVRGWLGGVVSPRHEVRRSEMDPASWLNYALTVTMALIALGVLPMVGVWRDAASFARAEAGARGWQAAMAAVDARHDAIAALRAAFTPGEGAMPRTGGTDPEFFPDPATAAAIPSPRTTTTLAATLQTTLIGDRPVEWLTCPRITSVFCVHAVGNDRTVGIAPLAVKTPRLGDAWFGIALIGVAAVVLIGAAVNAVLKALLGFHVPLEAVRRPRLTLSGRPRPAQGILGLGSHSLLVAPQARLREALLDTALPIDLADLSGGPIVFPDASVRRVVVSGLDMILRLPERRIKALEILERLDKWASDKAGGRQLVVLSDMAPMERIIDAHDEEKLIGDDISAEQSREQLRWSRLFEDFVTFTFPPVEKIDMAAVARFRRRFDLGESVEAAANEMRWLPGHVIDGIIGQQISRDLPSDTAIYPLGSEVYRKLYTKPVVRWASALDAASPEAAIDYLRGMAIEHYQQCWSASSWAERLVLDAIARGRFVNIAEALALRSLVRRGLVVFDPEPRLMNKSFGLFIRQNERPDTIDEWRARQPKGNWAKAQGPVMIIAPLLLLGVVTLALWSGEPLPALMPIVLAGAPLLIRSLVNRVGQSS